MTELVLKSAFLPSGNFLVALYKIKIYKLQNTGLKSKQSIFTSLNL